MRCRIRTVEDDRIVVTTLRHLRDNVYIDVAGGREPYFIQSVWDGKVAYFHESGYGYLPANRVVIVD